MRGLLSKNYKVILASAILLGGIGVGLYLVRTKQIFKPEASEQGGVNQILEVSKSNGDSLDYAGNDTFNTDTLDIKIKIKPQTN